MACNLSGRSLRPVVQRAMFRELTLTLGVTRAGENVSDLVERWQQRMRTTLGILKSTEIYKHVRCLNLSGLYDSKQSAGIVDLLFELGSLLATLTPGASDFWLSDAFWTAPKPSMIHTLRLEAPIRIRRAEALRIIMSFPRLTHLYYHVWSTDVLDTEDDSAELLWPHITPPKLHHLHIVNYFGFPRFAEHVFPPEEDVLLRFLAMPARGPDSALWRSVVKRAGDRLEELEVGGPAADFRMSAFVSVTLLTLRQTFR